MKKCYLLFAVALFSGWLHAQQTIRRCGTVEYVEQMMAQDPSLAGHMEDAEDQLQQALRDIQYNKTEAAVTTIPVVVHVVYRNSLDSLSDNRIQSQIDLMNKIFSKAYADTVSVPANWKSLVVDTKIQFCLAKQDPNGFLTNGITRTKTSTNMFFSSSNDVKHTSTGGEDAWNRDKYLNIWTCNLGGGLLGYAQPPGGNAATDGVVILYTCFGNPGTLSPYDLGKTAVHEVGHWLGLKHVWGDDSGACTGDDLINDTPNQAGSTYGCPGFPQTDNCTNTSPGYMFMNYMDYCDDGCMHLFTKDQSTRMGGVLNSSRILVKISNPGCTPGVNGISVIHGDEELDIFPNPNTGGHLSVSLPGDFQGTVSLSVFNLLGEKLLETKKTCNPSDKILLDMNSFEGGVYVLQARYGDYFFTRKIVLDK